MNPCEYFISLSSCSQTWRFVWHSSFGWVVANIERDFYKLILLPGIPIDTCRSWHNCSLMKIEKECLVKAQVSTKTR